MVTGLGRPEGTKDVALTVPVGAGEAGDELEDDVDMAETARGVSGRRRQQRVENMGYTGSRRWDLCQ